MKAKKIVPEQNEQPNPLPTPPKNEAKDELAAWQKQIVALAEARLSINDEGDVLSDLHGRAIGLCRIVEEMALNAPESEVSLSALAKVMQVVEEDIQIARWIARGRSLCPLWD
jgi:hypothetical protein